MAFSGYFERADAPSLTLRKAPCNRFKRAFEENPVKGPFDAPGARPPKSPRPAFRWTNPPPAVNA